MIQIHITIFAGAEGTDRFQVLAHQDGEPEDKLHDVTEQYEVAATTDPETGRSGFVVLKREA